MNRLRDPARWSRSRAGQEGLNKSLPGDHTGTVATVVGLPSKSVSRLLNSLKVRRLTPAKLVKERHDRVYEYPPRIRLPDTKKIRQPEARLVVEAIADQRLPRRFNTALLYHLLGQSLKGGTTGPQGRLPRPIHKALLRSGFTSHRPEGFKEPLNN